MQECQLAVVRYDEQTVRFGHPTGHFGQNFVRATPTVIGRPTCSATALRNWAAIWLGVPEIFARPPTSRNASSIDNPSTSGVVCSNYPEHGLAWRPSRPRTGGVTTIACGHSRLACRPPIAVRTPYALAS